MQRKKLIRDVVYEYVYFTPIEAIVIESPIFQRLRFIFQNSSAYLTYPSNQLTRFSHSLGVMHIGSQMILSALKNSDDNNFWEFLVQIERKLNEDLKKTGLFKSSIKEFQKNWEFGNISEFSIQDKLESKPKGIPLKADPNFLINYLWQSIRIACLIHDIGHFPFSHVFEMGLETFRVKYSDKSNALESFKKNICDGLGIDTKNIKKATELHEYFGAYILKDYLSHLDSNDVNTNILRLCLEFATQIFTYSYNDKDIDKITDEGYLLTLHQIVSSFLDADRMDYVLRDSHSSGLQVGNFDYKRIIDNLKILKIKRKAKQVEKPLFSIMITDKALSSVEQFYNHRYILYEYLYFHHNVCKYDGILMEIIAELLNEAIIKDNKEIKEVLLKAGFISANKNKSLSIVLSDKNSIQQKVAKYDDCWLRVLLQEILPLTESKPKFRNVNLLINSFLFRKSDNTYSVLKKEPDVDKFLEDFITFLKEKNKDLHGRLNEVMLTSNRTFKLAAIDTEIKYLRYLFSNYFKDDKDKPVKSDFIKRMNKSVGNNIVFIHKDVSPKLVDEDARIYFNGKYDFCAHISPYLESTKYIKKTSFNHYFGFVAEGIKFDTKLKNTCREYVFSGLMDTLKSCIESELAEIKTSQELSSRH